MKSYEQIEFFSGDIGLSHGEGWFSSVIRFFENWHTKKAWANHAFAFVGFDLIVEAVARITISKKEKYVGKKIKVYRIPLSENDRANFKYGMLRRFNNALGSYGWLKLPLFVLDACCTKISTFVGYKKPIFFFTRFFGISNIPVCSQLIIWGLHNLTSYRIRNLAEKEVNWKEISPDFLADLLELPINQAELIYENT